jgi:uncharacterized protein YukE
MNPCCEHLFREAKREIEIRDKRIKELQDECTRLFEPTREFWNGTALEKMNDKLEQERDRSEVLVEALEKLSLYVSHNGDTWVKERATEALKKYRGEA